MYIFITYLVCSYLAVFISIVFIIRADDMGTIEDMSEEDKHSMFIVFALAPVSIFVIVVVGLGKLFVQAMTFCVNFRRAD